MRWLLFALGMTVLSTTSSAHEITRSTLKIIHPWVHEMEEQQAALHLKIRNTGEVAERRLAATSPVADRVSILDPRGNQTTGLPIAARGEVSLPSSGPQIVLNGLKKPLRAHDSFDVMLEFEKAGQAKIEVLVEEAAALGEPHTGG